MQLKLPKLSEVSLSSGEQTDEKFVYFMAFLYGISTGEVNAVDMIKTTAKSNYGKFSQSFLDTFQLGVGWAYGLSNSLEMVAKKYEVNHEEQVQKLLGKFAQVVRLGDDLNIFLKGEMRSVILNYEIFYDRKLENMKLFLEMFYTLMSTSAFMVSANSIMTMLMGANDSEDILVSSMFGVTVSMSVFVFLMYKMFPRDKLGYNTADKDLKFRLRVYMSIGMGAAIGIVLFASGAVPTSLIIGVAAIPLLYPGMIARKMEANIKALNEVYPEFIRHFGDIYATVGSMGQALDAVLRSDFGAIHKHIIAFKNRIKNRIDQSLGFELLSRDTESESISNGNQVMSTALDKGADINETGNVIADITIKFNELRAKRQQTAKTFETITIILHVLTLAVFSLMSKLTGIFFDLINTVDISNSTFQLSPIDPEFMNAMLPIMILVISVISAIAIKVAQGGLYKTVFYNVAILALIGSLVSFGMDFFLSDFLESHVLDFVDEQVVP
jgi:flagellar protein FlaJ